MSDKNWQDIFSKITKEQLNFTKRPPLEDNPVLKNIDMDLYYRYKDILSSLDPYDFRYLWEEFSCEVHDVRELEYKDSHFYDFLSFLYYRSVDENLGKLSWLGNNDFKSTSKNIEIYFGKRPIRDEAWGLMTKYPINIEEMPFRKQGTNNTSEDGYTLTELLVVLTIIAGIVLYLFLK